MYKFTNVNSSAISKVGYDKENERLTVVFNHGAEYEYSHIPEQEYKNLVSAPSVGRYYNQHIRGLNSN